MDRLKWSNGSSINISEEVVYERNAVTIYDGNEKTGFQSGKLDLTSHRIVWRDTNDKMCIIELELKFILNIELKQYQQGGSGRTKQTFTRLLLNLETVDPSTQSYNNKPSVVDSRQYANKNSSIQFEFEHGGHNEFSQQLNQQLQRKKWINEATGGALGHSASTSSVGIVGIQRQIQERLDTQDQTIQNSFKDLNVLMLQAKEMVTLSNVITSKIAKEEKTGEAAATSEDNEDMKKLKTYFLNMGIIDNPVTREMSGSDYYKNLAMEIYTNLIKTIVDQGGIMTLADVFCRLNRARSIGGLVSAEDLLNACKCLNKLNLKLKYKIYKDLNLHILEIHSSEEYNALLDRSMFPCQRK